MLCASRRIKLINRLGRIVNITSVQGRVAEPYAAAYAMTKYATAAFSDVLRLEMKKFDVCVAVIEPGNFADTTESVNIDQISTEFEAMWSALSKSQQLDYGRSYIDYHIKFTDSVRRTSCFDLMPIINASSDALFSVKPRSRYSIPGGRGSCDPFQWKVFLQPYLPTWLMDHLLMRSYSHFPKPAIIQAE